MVKIKHKDFIGAVPIVPCENSSWIMGLRIYGEGRFPRVHLLRQVLCQESRIRRVYSDIYTDIKIANNTKINHICLKLSLREYSFITNKHNQELINILENQKIYEGFLKTMVSLLRSFKNDLPNGNVLILIFSIYSLVNKKVLFCKRVLESETRNISILRKPS